LPPGFDAAAFVDWAKEQANGAALHSYGTESAFQSDRQNGLARSFAAAIRQTGTRPRFKHKTGTSDMNVVGPVWQCPIVAYGPGDSQLDHTPQEHVVIDEYLQAIAILQTVLESKNRTRINAD
ncbi:MAG: M20/M25/M40 family metallo-hydrolase, partial [Anaerolineae bacterium]